MSEQTGLKATLQQHLTDAMRSKDRVRAGTLRMALTAITTEEVGGKEQRELSEEEVLRVGTKEGKKRGEAAQAYRDAGRPELAETEDAELAILEEYLPAQLSDEQIEVLVREAVTEAGVSDMRGMGQVMKVLQPRIAGQAEGGRVAAIVKKVLAG